MKILIEAYSSNRALEITSTWKVVFDKSCKNILITALLSIIEKSCDNWNNIYQNSLHWIVLIAEHDICFPRSRTLSFLLDMYVPQNGMEYERPSTGERRVNL